MLTAIFSPCRCYRYTLERDLLEPLLMPKDPRTASFIGLNPSTADEKIDDPTIRRCKAFARAWGYERLRMLNLYAWRSTDPSVLPGLPDPIGPENDVHLLSATEHAGVIVCAWGVNATPEREEAVVRMLHSAGRALSVLRWTVKSKRPEHPLYLPRTLTPIPYTESAR
jgi:hypothetical protein